MNGRTSLDVCITSINTVINTITCIEADHVVGVLVTEVVEEAITVRAQVAGGVGAGAEVLQSAAGIKVERDGGIKTSPGIIQRYVTFSDLFA